MLPALRAVFSVLAAFAVASAASRAPRFVEPWHKWMRIGVRIFKRSLRQPCIVSLAHIGRKTLYVKVRQLLVARLFRGEHFHKHPSVNRGLLRSLHAQQTRFSALNSF